MDFNLYQIADEYTRAFDALLELEDIPEEVIRDTLESLSYDFDIGALNIAAKIKNMDAEIGAMKTYEKRMSDKRKYHELKRDRLKDYLKNSMRKADIKKIYSSEISISLRKPSYRVIVDSMEYVPADYIEHKLEIKVNKVGLKDYLKAGNEVEGVKLEPCYSVMIK